MRVVVTELYTNRKREFNGDAPQVAAELLRVYPFVRQPEPGESRSAAFVEELVEHLNQVQSLEAEVEADHLQKAEDSTRDDSHVVEAFLGHHRTHHRALEAARFLAGSKDRHTKEHASRKLWEANGDHEKAALLTYGLEPTKENLKALRAHVAMSGLAKREATPCEAQTVEASVSDGLEVAKEVKRAFDDQFVIPIDLGGKHSQGSMLARDDKSGDTWLLKPSFGGQSPAAGEDEEPASQSRRESAFWHATDVFRMSSYFPVVHLLIIDGNEYAAIKLLPWSWRTLDKLQGENSSQARDLLSRYLSNGTIHRWAVVDAVLGNPDRHAQNMMYHAGDIRLIDQGSALAGPSFSPAHDQSSFIPYYLRAWSPGNFSQLPAHEKLRYMPRLSRQSAEELAEWVMQLDSDELRHVLVKYGINPDPSVDRLARIKMLCQESPADLAINRFWVDS